MEGHLLEVRGLSISFTQYEKGLHQTELPVIRDLSVTVDRGELVAVIGSSGSGKSLLAHAVMGLLPYNASSSGEMLYQGEPLTENWKRGLRGRNIVLVPQSVSYLDPLMQVGEQVRKGQKGPAILEKCRRVLGSYGLGPETEPLYPFQLSGGMTRRVLISTAVMEEPELVIADEPTPGLHLEAARRVLGHFREMAEQGAGVLLITHDLELALQVADRVVVLYAGTAIEETDSRSFSREETLYHPYTRALYRAMPEHGFSSVPGNQPYVKELPSGCPYRPRCERAKGECAGAVPFERTDRGGVRCLRWREWAFGQEEPSLREEAAL